MTQNTSSIPMLSSLVAMTCTYCTAEFNKQHSQIKKSKSGNHFCSRSCAASHNNKIPKRKQTRICAHCGKRTVKSNSTCKGCSSIILTEQYGEKRICDFKSTNDRHKYQNVRHHAHRVMKIMKVPKKCHVCNYDLHVELCHKKSIADFHPETKLKIVNERENLVYLCPNHHWELDNGHLELGAATGA